MTKQSRGAAFDPIFRFACLGAATMLLAALAGVVVSLAIGGWPAFAKFGSDLRWRKTTGSCHSGTVL